MSFCTKRNIVLCTHLFDSNTTLFSSSTSILFINLIFINSYLPIERQADVVKSCPYNLMRDWNLRYFLLRCTLHGPTLRNPDLLEPSCSIFNPSESCHRGAFKPKSSFFLCYDQHCVLDLLIECWICFLGG